MEKRTQPRIFNENTKCESHTPNVSIWTVFKCVLAMQVLLVNELYTANLSIYKLYLIDHLLKRNDILLFVVLLLLLFCHACSIHTGTTKSLPFPLFICDYNHHVSHICDIQLIYAKSFLFCSFYPFRLLISLLITAHFYFFIIFIRCLSWLRSHCPYFAMFPLSHPYSLSSVSRILPLSQRNYSTAPFLFSFFHFSAPPFTAVHHSSSD